MCFARLRLFAILLCFNFFNAQSQTGEYRARDKHVLLPARWPEQGNSACTRKKRKFVLQLSWKRNTFTCNQNDLAVRKLWIYVNFLFGKCALTTSVWEANMFIRHYHCISSTFKHVFHLAEDFLPGYRDIKSSRGEHAPATFQEFQTFKRLWKCLSGPITMCYLHDQTCKTCDKLMV